MGEELEADGVGVDEDTGKNKSGLFKIFRLEETKNGIFFSYLRVDVEKDPVGKLTVELAAHQSSGKKCGEENRRTGMREC